MADVDATNSTKSPGLDLDKYKARLEEGVDGGVIIGDLSDDAAALGMNAEETIAALVEVGFPLDRVKQNFVPPRDSAPPADSAPLPEPFDEKEFFRDAYSTVRRCVFTGVSSEQVDEFEEACSDAEELLSETDYGLFGLDDDFPYFYDFVMARKNFSVNEDANGRMDTSLSFSDYFRRVLFDVARDVANARANLTDDLRHINGDTPEVEALERAFEPLRELFRVQDAIKRGEIDDW